MRVNIEDFPEWNGEEETPERVVSVEIDSFDTYSLDHTLACVIRPALELFKKDNIACPHDIYEKYNPDVSKPTDDEAPFKEWEETVDKMITAFKYVEAGAIHDFPVPEDMEKEIEEGLALFAKYYLSLWW